MLTITVRERTVKDVFDAMEKNGFDYVRGKWFDFDDDGNFKGACIMGQAALNLNASSGDDQDEVDNIRFADIKAAWKYRTTGMEPDENDDYVDGDYVDGDWNMIELDGDPEVIERAIATGRSFGISSQLDRFPVTGKWADRGYNAGTTIINWNDRKAVEQPENVGYYDEETGIVVPPVYELPTYADVVKMAHDILSPYFKEKVYLAEITRVFALRRFDI